MNFRKFSGAKDSVFQGNTILGAKVTQTNQSQVVNNDAQFVDVIENDGLEKDQERHHVPQTMFTFNN